MAVKQNNTEGNGSSADANQVNGGTAGVKSTGTVTKSKKMNTNGTNGEGGGGGVLATSAVLGVTSNAELPGCSGNTGAFAKSKTLTSNPSPAAGQPANSPMVPQQSNDISQFLQLIELVEMKQQQMDLSKQMFEVYSHLIFKLARVQVPRQSPEEMKRFKEDIAKVGKFFAKCNEKLTYYHTYLPIVCKLITMSDGEKPSCALAVIFQLFSPDMVYEAVQSLLDDEVPDQSIRKTVCLLVEWLRLCNFCQNLHIWIMAILNGLEKQHKTALLDQISLENIDVLFPSLIVPVLRPKVAPIVFHMLSIIDQTPVVFHKILPNFTLVISLLKKQSNSSEDYAESTKAVLKQLVDRTSALMVRFYRYDDLYDPIELALKDFQPSVNYLSYAYGNKSLDTTEDSTFSCQATQIVNAKVGLVNLGNTCYMNSVLQALAMTKEFSREILLSDSKSPLLVKMQQQIALMLYSTRQELTPSKVLNATRPPGFSPGLQQDSSEFLGYLLETLHEQEVAFRKKPGKKIEQAKLAKDVTDSRGASALCQGDDDDGEDEEELKNASEEVKVSTINSQNISTNNSNTNTTTSTTIAADSLSTNLIVVDNTKHSTSQHPSSTTATAATTPQTINSTIEKTFTGKLATTYKCLTCGWKSCNIDSFRDLQLSFPDVKNDCASNYSVQDLIEYYCSSEKLYGDNQYFCERCKKLSDAERYINVISAPKNLILTLKHFKYDQKYHMRAKLMHKVFHDEKVSLKVCSSENLEEIATVHYDIYAGVVHSGFSMDSGHYYTYAADATNKWYKFNDSIVTPSRTEELHNLTPPNTPYILFYQMGARSNEAPETSASTKVIKVDVPTPLTLEELPRDLRDMVTHDNFAFSEELKLRRFKNNAALNASSSTMKTKGSRRDSFDDDEDEQPPPASGCGGNNMLNNVNRFVY